MCLPKKDSFLGGGIPAGSVVLLINESDEEEDGAVDYTRLFNFFLKLLGLKQNVVEYFTGYSSNTSWLRARPAETGYSTRLSRPHRSRENRRCWTRCRT